MRRPTLLLLAALLLAILPARAQVPMLPPLANQYGQPSTSIWPSPLALVSTPTVQNAAYSSGNCMGGFNSVSVVRVNGGGLFLSSVTVRSVSGQTGTILIYLFDANPSASTCTDKSTFTIASADVAKLHGKPSSVTLAASTGSSVTFGEQDFSAPRAMIAGGGANSGVATIYYALVAGGSITPGSTTDIQVSIEGVQ